MISVCLPSGAQNFISYCMLRVVMMIAKVQIDCASVCTLKHSILASFLNIAAQNKHWVDTAVKWSCVVLKSLVYLLWVLFDIIPPSVGYNVHWITSSVAKLSVTFFMHVFIEPVFFDTDIFVVVERCLTISSFLFVVVDEQIMFVWCVFSTSEVCCLQWNWSLTEMVSLVDVVTVCVVQTPQRPACVQLGFCVNVEQLSLTSFPPIWLTFPVVGHYGPISKWNCTYLHYYF